MTPRTKKLTNGRHAGTRRKPANAPVLLVNIGQLLTMSAPHLPNGPRRAAALSELGIIEDAAVLCAGGKIISVGRSREALRDRWIKINHHRIREIDCRGRVVTPGFIDSHTHPVFAAPRLVDFEKRISGATYEEIAQAGGGIRASIEGVRTQPRTVLADKCLQAFNQMLAQGTTSVEAKSGYGLNYDSELKSLEAIRAASKQWPGTVIPTLLGAHVVPPEFKHDRAQYVRLICDKMIPDASRKKLAAYVDVFCERGAFTLDESLEILRTAQQHGLGARAHVCQLSPASLRAFEEFAPASFDHLDHVSDDDITWLSTRDTVTTLLPAANYFLGLKDYPPARRLIDAGAPVALATDFNPGTSPTPSMPFVMSLACTHMKMTPAEVIAASTINAAHALRLADQKGSIVPGKDADLALFDVTDFREVSYWFATNKCLGTIVAGEPAGLLD